jgi:hypothetical protein
MLREMWAHLMKSRALITQPEPVPADVPRPELHCCPFCGSGISRLHLYQGGILGRNMSGVGGRKVRAAIRCLSCNRQHALQGDTPYECGVVLILLKHPRKRPGEKQRMFRTGAVV